jgi:hypothetical protein
MIIVNEDNSIYLTRGDDVAFEVGATDESGETVTFSVGDKIHLTVTEKKNCGKVVLDKTVQVNTESDAVTIRLTDEETKIGEVISKPVDYWYDIELIDCNENIYTIVGYDEDGAKIFRLFPEGEEVR